MINEIEYNADRVRQEQETACRQNLEAAMQHLLKPSRIIPAVSTWLRLLQDGFGSATRFPFLVLHGASRYGKTQFARQLFGAARTLVVSCQGVKQPNLKSFSRSKHKAIVFDEADHTLILANKQLFQAGTVSILLVQSQCQEHAYEVWLYGVPLIISTNTWDATADEWLPANSILVPVDSPLWADNLPVADAPRAT